MSSDYLDSKEEGNDDLDLLEEGSVHSHTESEITRHSSAVSVLSSKEQPGDRDDRSVKSGVSSSRGPLRETSSKPHKHSSRDGDGLVRPFAEMNSSSPKVYPRKRDMVPIHTMIGEKQLSVRVMQFNVLADGLAGMDRRHGDFCRASPSSLQWENRKRQLIQECTQYKPDIITLHECDHYYDFFLPELNRYGYDGCFASKPMSQCLEVSCLPDGSAMFINRRAYRLVSSQQFAYATSDSDDGSEEYYSENKVMWEGKLVPRCRQRKQQNQVACLSIVEHLTILDAPPILIATTHLKAGKTMSCEELRRAQILQLLSSMSQVYSAFEAAGRTPAILMTGDLNTIAGTEGFAPLCYNAIKGHKLGLRSLLNDDVIPENMTGGEIYTTWKARREQIVKSSREKSVKSVFDPNLITEQDDRNSSGGGGSDKKEKKATKDGKECTGRKERGGVVEGDETHDGVRLDKDGVLRHVKAKEKNVKEHVSKHAADFIFYSPLRVDRPGFRALAVVDMFDEEDVGKRLLPSSKYPSDHIAIVGDFELLW